MTVLCRVLAPLDGLPMQKMDISLLTCCKSLETVPTGISERIR